MANVMVISTGKVLMSKLLSQTCLFCNEQSAIERRHNVGNISFVSTLISLFDTLINRRRTMKTLALNLSLIFCQKVFHYAILPIYKTAKYKYIHKAKAIKFHIIPNVPVKTKKKVSLHPSFLPSHIKLNQNQQVRDDYHKYIQNSAIVDQEQLCWPEFNYLQGNLMRKLIDLKKDKKGEPLNEITCFQESLLLRVCCWFVCLIV